MIVMDPQKRKITGPTINLSKEDDQGLRIITSVNPDDYDINVAHYLFG